MGRGFETRRAHHLFIGYQRDVFVPLSISCPNAIESMHMQLRKIVKNRGHFPSDEAASKLLYLALRNIEKDWKMPPITWRQAVNQFAILFGERFTSAIN
ncbi:transposase [Burkholderia thailandensis]|uniref:transposase n=2 Tax=Burkholderia thailandensis TaxID=57975 RepID=UPI0030C66AA6